MDWSGLLDVLLQPFIWLLDGIIYVVGYTLYYAMDGLFVAVYLLFSALDLSQFVFDFVGQVAGLPTQLLFLLDAIAFPQCLAIIAGAYTVRFLLNLIPGAVTRV